MAQSRRQGMLGMTDMKKVFAAAATFIGLVACDAPTLSGSSSSQQTGVLDAASASQTQEALESQGSAPLTSRIASTLGASKFGTQIANAVQTNPNIRASTANILIAQADLRSAEGAYLPEVTAGATATERLNGSSSATPYLRISQLIYDGGASRSRVAAQTANLTSARSARLVTASDFTLQAVQAHVDYATTNRIVELAQQNLSAHKRFTRLIEERREGGVGSQSDLLTVQSRLAAAETLFVNARAERDRAKARFVEVIGTQPTGTAWPPAAPNLPGNDTAAINGSPRMQALDARLAAAQSQLEAVRQGRLPRVEMSATAQQQDDGSGGDVALDLAVDYTFDTRGEASAAVQRAYADTLRLESEKSTLARDIARSLDFLRSDRTSGKQLLSAAQRSVRTNRANVRATEEEFSIGRRDLLQVLDAQRDLVVAQRSVIEAERSLLLTGYDALALTGDIIPVFNISLQELVFTE